MIHDILTMIPGPTPVHRRILDRLAEPTVSHLYPDFLESYRETLVNFRTIMRSENAQPFILAGGGTLAMEMALVNTIAENERILIISHGYFGERFKQLAEAMGISCAMLEADWGRMVSPESLENHLRENRYAAVTITHVDTSTGTCSPAAEYCEILKDRDELVVLDGVCASAGVDERFDEWGIDVLLTAPQKAFGAPPGLAMCLFSERAMEKRKSMSRINAYYADVMRWLPIMENPGGYYSTPAVNEIIALHEATEIILEEGLDERFHRHAAITKAMRAGMAELGMHPFTDEDCRADTLSLFTYPDDVEDGAFRSAMAAGGVVIAGCLGELAGKGCRIGHMGNIGAEEVYKTLEAAEGAAGTCGIKTKPGCTVQAAAEYLKW